VRGQVSLSILFRHCKHSAAIHDSIARRRPPQQFRGRKIFAIGDQKGRAGFCGWDGCEGLSFGNLLHIVPNLVQFTMERKTIPTLGARFFKTDAGTEPVRNWLKDLPVVERKAIGEDIKTVQFGWPLGMPLVDHLEGGIWEVRTRLSTRIARVLFVLDGDTMVLLHGFIKKEQKTPKPELDLAKDRLKLLKRRK
jgi:phage-related protein